MTDWTNNEVCIAASMAAVTEWLIADSTGGGSFYFNMHRLFPERFASGDPTTWTDDDFWTELFTGSMRFPEIRSILELEGRTWLRYDTAKEPNNRTLHRLHQLTGWIIQNDYEAPNAGFEEPFGFEGTLICNADGVRDKDRPYRPRCKICNRKREADEFPADGGGTICDDCQNAGLGE